MVVSQLFDCILKSAEQVFNVIEVFDKPSYPADSNRNLESNPHGMKSMRHCYQLQSVADSKLVDEEC